MKTTTASFPVLRLAAVTMLAIINAQFSTTFAQGTAFTYQGRLNSGANPAGGIYDLRFAIYDAAGGDSLWGVLTNAATPVTNGLFTVTLDFGPGVFTGNPRWLEIAVRTNGATAFATLAPRQPITPTPYAITAENLNGTLPASQVSGVLPLAQLPAGIVTNGTSGVNFSGTLAGNGAGLTNLQLSAIGPAGTFALLQNYFSPTRNLTVGNHPRNIIAADMNSDGKLDLIVPTGLNGTVNSVLNVLTNDGSGGFGLSTTLTVGKGCYATVAADFNNDGWIDLAAANYSDKTVTVYLNDGNDGFGLFATVGIPTNNISAGPYGLAMADINGDGRPDLITANSGDNSLTVLTNNGTGFGINTTLAVGAGTRFVLAADVNGDGKPDLISANSLTNTLTVLTNNGGGGFGWCATLTAGNFPWGAATADVNGDGKTDIISANVADSTVTVLTNNGSGGFGFNATYSVGLNPRSVVAADLNSDGKPDLISANFSDNTLTVLTNNGSGGFGYYCTFPVGLNPWGLVAADLNGDGRLDLATANNGDTTVSLMLSVAQVLSLGNTNTTVLATHFIGDGSGLTGVIAAPAATFTGLLAGDVSGTQNATLVVAVGGQSAALVAAGASAAYTATSGNTDNAIVKRDGSGNFSATTVTANLAGNATTATVASNVVSGIAITNAFITNSVFAGNGSGLSNLNAANLIGTVPVNQVSGVLPLAQLPAVVITNNAANATLAGSFFGNFGGLFYGSGNGLTGLNPANISSGTAAINISGNAATATTAVSATNLIGNVADAQVPANFARLNGTNNFTGTNNFASVVIATNVNNIIAGVFTGNGGALTNLNTAQFANSVLTNGETGLTLGGTFNGNLNGNGANVTNVNAAQLNGLSATNFWQTGGNAGTSGANFLGTTDNNPLHLQVNRVLAWRAEPQASGAPSIIGGTEANSAASYASFIGAGDANKIQTNAPYSAIVGGLGNTVQNNAGYASIAGGSGNTIQTNTFYSTIGGGLNNTIGASAGDAIIAGGAGNTILDSALSSVIGGGTQNTNGGYGSVVPGGSKNAAWGTFSFAAGQQAKAINNGTFVWADALYTDFISTANNQFLIRASGGVGIGTNAPQTALHVVGTVTATAFAGNVTGNLSGNASTATTANNFSGSLSGDVTGPQSATVVSTVGGSGAANIHTAEQAANAATSAATANVMVKRDAAGNFSAGTITANLAGSAALASNVVAGIAITNAFITNSVFAGNGGGLTNLNASQLAGGTIPLAQLPAAVVTNNETGVNISGAFSGNGANVTNVNAAALNGLNATNFWKVGGNNVSAGQFIGSTNNQPVEIWVNNSRAFRFDVNNNVIGGAANNTMAAGISAAVIAGGQQNVVSDTWGAVLGGVGNTAGSANYAWSSFNEGQVVAGGFYNTASGPFSFIGSGNGNIASGVGSVVCGGGITGFDINSMSGNFNQAGGMSAFVPCGAGNRAMGDYSFAAGLNAQALHTNTFVWSEGTTFASTANNQFLIHASGGVGIGKNNPATALDVNGTVTATGFSGNGSGLTNLNPTSITGIYGTAAGIGYSPVYVNSSGQLGQSTNTMVDSAGVNKGALLPGLVFGQPGSGEGLASARTGTTNLNGLSFYTGYTIRLAIANGGNVGIGTNAPVYPLEMGSGAYCTAAGVWTSVSDRNVKEGFTAIAPGDVLAKVAALPITEWKYKIEPNGIKHLGPVAQDFHAAFGLGDSDKAIGSVDEGGVALAAIQGLNQKMNAKDAEIQELKQSVAELKQLVQTLAEKK